jgi:hypothetical protein
MDVSTWVDGLTEHEVQQMFESQGVELIQLKALSRNHNSKNQIYLAPDLSDVPQVDVQNVVTSQGFSKKKKAGKPIYHVPIKWAWLLDNGFSAAPGAQLIFYPQYPEVRLSGLLSGAKSAPNKLLNIEHRGQEEGRLLLFGSNGDQTFGLILSKYSPAHSYFINCLSSESALTSISIRGLEKIDSRSNLCEMLSKIHAKGWLNSVQLSKNSGIQDCKGPRCGGHTLEANLGIPMNGIPEPDFGNWEVKSHKVNNFNNIATGKVTLMTPEPDLGAYSELGVAWFAEHFGSLNSEKTRFDFTGVHSVDKGINLKTRLTLSLIGYNRVEEKIESDGYVALTSENCELVSGWSFGKLLTHWQKKHSFTAYIPTLYSPDQPRMFMYGKNVHLGSVTRFEYFLKAISDGKVVYDPGIKLEKQVSGNWKAKARSQFRINFKDLASLYENFEEVDVSSSN